MAISPIGRESPSGLDCLAPDLSSYLGLSGPYGVDHRSIEQRETVDANRTNGEFGVVWRADLAGDRDVEDTVQGLRHDSGDRDPSPWYAQHESATITRQLLGEDGTGVAAIAIALHPGSVQRAPDSIGGCDASS